MGAMNFIEEKIEGNNKKIENFNKKISELRVENQQLQSMKKDAEEHDKAEESKKAE